MLSKGEVFSVQTDGAIERYVVVDVLPVDPDDPDATVVRLERVRLGDVLGLGAPEPGPWSRVADRKARVWVNIRGAWIDDAGVRMEWRFLLANHGPVSRMPDLPPELAAGFIRTKPYNPVLVAEAVRLVESRQFASVSYLARCLGIGFEQAHQLADVMESWGVVGTRTGSMAPPVLMSETEAEVVAREIEGMHSR